MWEFLANAEKFKFLDGGMGTMLQAAGLKAGQRPEIIMYEAPEKLIEIHKAYLNAGANIICTNTFGANRKKLEGSNLNTADVVARAVKCAKEACKQAGKDALVALDVGPIGELLEPVGILTFEEAYAVFTDVVCAGVESGADVIIIETMTDLYEAKAALLAAKENSSLPVLISMTFEEGGRTFAGVPVEAMAQTLSGLGASAIGINCSLGPAELMPIVKRLCAATNLPVFLKPNAGLPNPETGEFSFTSEEFSKQMQPCFENGVSMVGGCCGTTPEMIKGLHNQFKNASPAKRVFLAKSSVCSATKVQPITGVCPVGERINPTGKKRLQQALNEKDLAYVQNLAVAQKQDGALVLDINVGAPGVDEAELLPLAVKAVQAVSDLPLQLDSANPKALEAALRVVNGKVLVNSTTGEKEKMQVILPLCKKYGAAIIGLTLNENGIPETAQGRFEIAKQIMNEALNAGIAKEDIYIDCLVMTASTDAKAAMQTLEALRMVKEKLGLKTLLGVSNVSFGLPNRELVNQTFLTMALQSGLDLPIMNPAIKGMMDAVSAFSLLSGSENGTDNFVQKHSGTQAVANVSLEEPSLKLAIEQGLKEQAAKQMKAELNAGKNGLELINSELMPALDAVGHGYETGKLFLPQLLSSAGAAQAAFEVLRAFMGDAQENGPVVVVATVQGDVHDIGKNIAKVLLSNYGFTVIDLGRDVAPEKVLLATKESGAKLVGLSALMTTTLPAMEKTIMLLRSEKIDCKIMVGGAVLTKEYAKKIGADYFTPDAKRGVDIAKEVYGLS